MYHENIEQVVSTHMGKCKKTVVILPENMALQVYNILKAAKQPVFYGKDVIYENKFGYRYHGHYPETILQRIKYSFNNGIV